QQAQRGQGAVRGRRVGAGEAFDEGSRQRLRQARPRERAGPRREGQPEPLQVDPQRAELQVSARRGRERLRHPAAPVAGADQGRRPGAAGGARVNRFDIIKRPLDTEKLDRMRDKENKFAFEIDMKANKTEVKQAIEGLFKVKVVAVKTAIIRGKFRRIGRNEGKRPNWKKAIVTLKEGDAISLFEGKHAMKFYTPTSPGR